MEDFKDVVSFDNLYKAYRDSKKGKGYKRSSAKFEIMALEGISLLRSQLENKTYKVSKYNEFKVFEPKERVVKACEFKDKVVQHSLCDNILIPKLSKVFIKDNCAGQVGKGTLFGLDRLKENMLDFFKHNKNDGYILKCDISKFFYNIDHEVLKDMVRRYFEDEDVIWLCNLFIDSTEGVGIPLGNQISQVFALMYLDKMDHYILENLRIKYYGRYMDDFYLIHKDKKYLQKCLREIKKIVDELKLSLNNKTQIFPFKNGIKFLGFHTYITDSGIAIRKIDNHNKRIAKKKFTKMAKLLVENKISDKCFYESYNSWKNHVSHGNCKKLVQQMDLLINNILDAR